jgi:hypothetical protein
MPPYVVRNATVFMLRSLNDLIPTPALANLNFTVHADSFTIKSKNSRPSFGQMIDTIAK